MFEGALQGAVAVGNFLLGLRWDRAQRSVRLILVRAFWAWGL